MAVSMCNVRRALLDDGVGNNCRFQYLERLRENDRGEEVEMASLEVTDTSKLTRLVMARRPPALYLVAKTVRPEIAIEARPSPPSPSVARIAARKAAPIPAAP